MSDLKKIKFQYQSLFIESAYIFEDGDIIIFANGDSTGCGVSKKFSNLYDGKTFQSKLTLKVSSSSCFFDLKDNEFGLCIDFKFTIYKFNDRKTEFNEIQPIKLQDFETGRKLIKLCNGDILFFKFYMGSQAISIYRKNYKDFYYSTNNFIYECQNNLHIEDCEDLIELNNNEFLVYKRSILTPESLILSIYNNENYQIKKKNSIIAEIKDEEKTVKKKLYFTTILYKNKNKLICGGCFNLYIIDTNSLELETTIKLDKTISKILVRPKGNIFVLTYVQKNYQKDENREVSYDLYDYFMNNIKIDFKYNEMIKNEETDITDKTGIYTSFFEFYNYPNNGFVLIIDKRKLIIYENYGD